MACWDFGRGKQVDLIFQTRLGPPGLILPNAPIVGKTSCRRASYRLGHWTSGEIIMKPITDVHNSSQQVEGHGIRNLERNKEIYS